MIKIQPELIQGSEEWFQARCGLLTASEMKLIISPGKLQPANNDKTRAHFHELLAQRITGYVEPHYVSDAMLRGKGDEIDALSIYNEHYAPLQTVGFITNDEWGFTLGYSPDALAGEDGLVETKSRCQKYQIETILKDAMPDEYSIQVQTGLLVTRRKWCDFISYCGGLPMYTKRIYPDLKVQEAIIEAAKAFEVQMAISLAIYNERMKSNDMRLIPTERKIEEEITL